MDKNIEEALINFSFKTLVRPTILNSINNFLKFANDEDLMKVNNFINELDNKESEK
jgi:hypothetical protein